ncbi:MAG: Bile acid sodium symporter [Candidatus Ozemobacter sibiricus]|jgi:predicted Na+-dependent transporter|uniref:Bile acid sodium symporter n=1 Tax=Candidatus Ozemobacter sibiricus TaxID=2268124 RepID=A0A367ZU61_9BACT|nr:MAG: Bile acid sodium symporter [Candidatus Ozemobacter sibiricus]
MRTLGSSINRFFEAHLFACLLAGSTVGWLLDNLLAQGRFLVPGMFAFMTFVASLRCSWSDVRRVLAHPGPLLVTLLLLHLAVPLLVKLAARFVPPASPEILAGFILVGAVPIGVTSAIWTGLAGGDVPLALTAATLDTMLSPLVTPAVISLFLGLEVQIDLWGLQLALLQMLVIPAAIGLTVRDMSGGAAHERAAPFLGPPAHAMLVAVIAINVATVRGALEARSVDLGWWVLGAFLLVAADYLLGLAVPRGLGYPPPVATALAYSVGIRNLSAGLVIAMAHFPPATGIPVVLSMLFQQPLAALLRHWLQPRTARPTETPDFPLSPPTPDQAATNEARTP